MAARAAGAERAGVNGQVKPFIGTPCKGESEKRVAAAATAKAKNHPGVNCLSGKLDHKPHHQWRAGLNLSGNPAILAQASLRLA